MRISVRVVHALAGALGLMLVVGASAQLGENVRYRPGEVVKP